MPSKEDLYRRRHLRLVVDNTPSTQRFRRRFRSRHGRRTENVRAQFVSAHPGNSLNVQDPFGGHSHPLGHGLRRNSDAVCEPTSAADDSFGARKRLSCGITHTPRLKQQFNESQVMVAGNYQAGLSRWRMATSLKPAEPRGPGTFGTRFLAAMEEAGFDRKDIAAEFGISVQAVGNWVNGETHPSKEKYVQLADKLGVNVPWLMDGKPPKYPDTVTPGGKPLLQKPVPVISRVQAGAWNEAVAYETDDCLWATTPVGDHVFALEISGDSMLPRFQEGDHVIIDTRAEPKPGGFVVAMRDADSEATFKKYRIRGHDDDGKPIIELAPLNPDWPVIVLDAKNPGKIIGSMIEHRSYRTT